MLDAFVAAEGEPEALQISGGEPSIHPQVLEMLAAGQAARDPPRDAQHERDPAGTRPAVRARARRARHPRVPAVRRLRRHDAPCDPWPATCGTTSAGRSTAAPRPALSVSLVGGDRARRQRARARGDRALRRRASGGQRRVLPARDPFRAPPRLRSAGAAHERRRDPRHLSSSCPNGFASDDFVAGALLLARHAARHHLRRSYDGDDRRAAAATGGRRGLPRLRHATGQFPTLTCGARSRGCSRASAAGRQRGRRRATRVRRRAASACRLSFRTVAAKALHDRRSQDFQDPYTLERAQAHEVLRGGDRRPTGG